MTRLGWLDAGSGASGDMLLGALTSLGVLDPPAVVEALHLRAAVSVGVVQRAGLAATHVSVRPAEDQPHRAWGDVRAVLDATDLPEPVRARAQSVFARLAAAEGTVHGIDPQQVHFHEVGAVDAMVDVVGACLGLAALGLDALHCTPVALGGGTVRAAHGSLPVPGPAVLALLSAGRVPAYGGPHDVELCTPTGAALLAEHVTAWGPLPGLRVDGVGTGAGSRDLADSPNVLRLVVGESTATPGPSAPDLLLECNVDDMDPRLWPPVLSRLLRSGASDAWLTPILMKKGRPAHTLSVLVPAGHADAVRRVVFGETTTLGLREQPVAKTSLHRSFVTVSVDGQPVSVKLGSRDGAVLNAQPEYEDVAAAAAALDRPVKAVLAAAVAAAHEAGHVAG